MQSAFRTILRYLRFKPVSISKPVKTEYGLELALSGEKLIVGVNSASVFTLFPMYLSSVSTVDERIKAIRVKRVLNPVFVPQYAATIMGEEVYATWWTQD